MNFMDYRQLIVASAALGVFVLCGLAGCGSGELPMADVTGHVKYDGQPIEKGLIAFHPVDGKGPSEGGEIVNGAYSVRVPPGTKRIEIRGSKLVGKRPATPENPVEEDIFKEFIPPAYHVQSTLTKEVEMPSTVIDLDLEAVASQGKR